MWEDVLEDTEQKANSQESGVVLDQGRQCHDNTPAEDNASHVYRRSPEPVKDHVGRNLAKYKGNEEDGGDDVVLNALEVQVISHSFNLCISYS